MLALGLDIGGANLKAASSAGQARSESFEIWRAPQELAARLRALISRFPPPDLIAVTMTAELADCFATKSEGVAAIVAAVQEAAGQTPVAIWQTSGEFASPSSAVLAPRAVAAANWHALATWAGQLAPRGCALLFDIGSTTTDLIPLVDGRPVAVGMTDVERLLSGELVYTGARRTPLCAVASQVTVRGRKCGVAAELFATTLDAYLLLGLIPEDASDTHTADGRPATVACAHDRMARMACCDREEIDLTEARAMATDFFVAQRGQLFAALDAVVSRAGAPIETVILSGSGAFLAQQVLADHPLTRSAQLIRLADQLSPELSESSCAYAVAMLAGQRLTPL